MKWNPENSAPSGETAVSTVDRQGLRRIIELEAERRAVEDMYKSFDVDVEVPKFEFPKEILSLLRAKMELRPFETLLWIPEKARRPEIERLMPRAGIEHYMDPQFDAGVNAAALATSLSRRPEGPYLLFTTTAPRVEPWTAGKNPSEVKAILGTLRESGLALDEYLLLERLATTELDWRDESEERMDKNNGVMLLGSRLADGRTLIVHNTPAGEMTFGAGTENLAHPRVGARVGVVIPLET
ncbi:hypothetical protein HY633_00135 [Candidatus Uhrbacteria bacterium]|nr:hypothetical protein [Candidatus Uhrbacteria bacterium]